jgi:hypothetical protein
LFDLWAKFSRQILINRIWGAALNQIFSSKKYIHKVKEV